MPHLKANKKAVADVAEVMHFENWLRFYFVSEVEGELRLSVPQEAQDKIEAEYPHLAPILKHVDGQAVTYENSMNAVCTYVSNEFDGKKYPAGTVERVFDSTELNKEMQLFGMWIQGHESQLEQTFMDFATWRSLFEEWRNSAQVKAHVKNLNARTVTDCNPTSQ